MIYEQLQGFCQARIMEFDKIPLKRKETLKKITAYIASKLKAQELAQLVYICTHLCAGHWCNSGGFYVQWFRKRNRKGRIIP